LCAATATVEIAGQVILKRGIASGFRPRRYYTVPKETVEAVLEDFEQLVDFFLIEFQRILFAENVLHTVLVSCNSRTKTNQKAETDDFLGFHCCFHRLLADPLHSFLGLGRDCRDHHILHPAYLHQQPRDH
jgi:hypothetical protein